jgi:hypothetical protein
MDQAGQKGAGGQHHRTRLEHDAQLRADAGHPIAFQNQVIHRLLEQGQIGLIFQPAAHRLLVQHAVGLRSRRPHCRAFGGIQDAELDARFVGGDRHGAAQRIDFLDQMPLADAADGRIARHRAQRFDVVREQQGFHPHARRSQRRLAARMAAAHHYHIKNIGENHGLISASGGLTGGGFYAKPLAAFMRCFT